MGLNNIFCAGYVYYRMTRAEIEVLQFVVSEVPHYRKSILIVSKKTDFDKTKAQTDEQLHVLGIRTILILLRNKDGISTIFA